jgi:hypothetical protein
MSARSKTPTKKGTPAAAPTTGEKTTVYDSGNFKREAVTPIKAISMKTPGDAKPKKADPADLPHVKLRAMSEVARAQTPQNLGNLAPPYDPHKARVRSLQDYVIWGCVAIILASAIALVVWFAAR